MTRTGSACRRCGRRRLGSGALLLLGLVTLLASPASPSPAQSEGGDSWIRLPSPSVEDLEDAVGEQLQTLRNYVASRVDDPSATAVELADAIGELGRHYHAYQLTGAAEACYVIARRLAPQDFRWPYLSGYLYQSAGRLAEASAQYERALEIVPDVPPALIRLGQTYLAQNQPEKAEPLLLRAYQLDPSASAALAELGQLYLSTERYAEAVEALEKALELQPDADLLYYPLGQSYRALGELDKAREALARRGRVGVRPADPEVDGLEALTTGERVHLLRGRSAFDAGRFAEAAEEFRRALAAEPSSIRARVNLASALGGTGEFEEAVAVLEEVVEIAPGNATALYNLGLVHERMGDDATAVERFAEAVSYERRDPQMRLRLADALRRLGRSEEALPHYSRAVALDASNEAAWIGEADVLARLGRYEEALTRLETARQLMPTAGSLAFALARILAACPDPALRDGERALELALRVARAQPKLEHFQVVAQAYAETGRCAEAAEWQSRLVEQAREQGATDAAALLDVVRARYAAGPPCRPPIPESRP